MKNGNQTKPSWSSPLDCEVGLALKMQLHPTASYSCDGGGGPFFNGSSDQQHVYELANGVLVQRSPDYSSSRASGGMNMNMNMMGVCGKALFTTSQLQELERQKMIHKYILASIPVPPQLLLSTSPSPPPSSLSQCNTAGVDMRYSTNGSDPEPWRCKRTDGKKWRCSRDVAPDQKYCERHAHKNRPRSRKHVENSPHNYSHKPSVLPSNHPTSLPRSTPTLPSIASSNPYHQTRCIEWLMRGGGNSDDSPARKQQPWEQQLTRDKIHDNVYHPHFDEKQGLMGLNPHDQLILNPDTAQATTRLFIDAWGKEGVEGKGAGAAEKKLWPPSSSLSLSMCGDEKEREGEGLMLKNQWLNNPVSLMSSPPPGGPLGEALCLGFNTGRIRGGGGGGGFNLASAHGYSNSNTNSSSCSKSSCEDGSHALNFIG